MSNTDYIVSLDIGTSKVRVIIGELDNGSINILGVGTSDSEGIKKGAIVDIDLTVKSIRQAVENAERMVGVPIDQVFAGISGNHIKLQPSQGVVAVSSPDREIGEEDIIRVIEASKVVAIPPEREIIDVVPKQFIVDGLSDITDPRGMIGVRLEMEGTIITGSKTIIHNLVRCIERAGLSIAGIFLQPLAASTLALSKDEMQMGCALIDIGGGQTNISIFENGSLVDAFVIPIGGEYITNDIAIGLKTSSDIAEKIKIKHGCALIDQAVKEEVFTVPRIGSNLHKEFNQVDLAHIIEPRLEEMLEIIHQEIIRAGYHSIPGGYVLIGGVSATQGIVELAREVLQNSVRISAPDYLGVREPQYTTGVGIIKYASKHARRHLHQDEAISLPNNQRNQAKRMKSEQGMMAVGRYSVKERVKNWLKEFI